MVRVMGLPEVPILGLAQTAALFACEFQISDFVEQQLARA